MIVFGTRGRTIAGQEMIEGVKCPNCGNTQHATFGILRYFHIFWIPTFPTSRVAGIMCLNCKGTFTDEEIPGELGRQIRSSVFNRKNTLPMFAGLAIIACLMIFAMITSVIDDRRDIEYLGKPEKNDFYIVDFTKIFKDADSEYNYGIMRVKSVSGNMVELMVSKIGYMLSTGPARDIDKGKAKKNSYYAGETIHIDISGLGKMKEDGAICSVERR
ncbi:hypothetical protein [Desulfonema magnum]|nr:hypothetical protein [Desulfonema magnum]